MRVLATQVTKVVVGRGACGCAYGVELAVLYAVYCQSRETFFHGKKYNIRKRNSYPGKYYNKIIETYNFLFRIYSHLKLSSKSCTVYIEYTLGRRCTLFSADLRCLLSPLCLLHRLNSPPFFCGHT